jgi:hypothetical protein
MKRICIVVKFQKDPEFKWTATGGCFKEGKPVLYEPAEAYQEYDFRDVQVEVRLDHKANEIYQEAVIEPAAIDQLAQNEDDIESSTPNKDYDY